MKSTLIIVLVIAILGVLGYLFYGSLQDLGSEQTDFDFQPAEIISDEFDELNDLGDSELLLDSEIDDLESLDFGSTEITEEDIEKAIEVTEQEEATIDAGIDELEGLDF